MVMPSGPPQLGADAEPSASGTPPSSAAIVVMRIGPQTGADRPGRIASRGAIRVIALGVQREIDHHDAFFFTMPRAE